MKTGMTDLINLQEELAEFFCEDSNTFRLEECYKSLNSFFSKFKQVQFEGPAENKIEFNWAKARRRRHF